MNGAEVLRQLGVLRDACVAVRGADYCTDTVVQALAAVARHETCLNSCPPFDKTHNNYGAVQCPVRPTAAGCPAGCFGADDTSPTSTGGSIAYHACFVHHDTEEEGARAFVSLVTVARPGIAASLPSGNCLSIAEAMRAARYYEGKGATQEERIAGYSTALCRNAKANAKDAGVGLLVTLPEPPPPTVPPQAGAAAFAAIALGFGYLVHHLTRQGAS